jgi:hypothetical protein
VRKHRLNSQTPTQRYLTLCSVVQPQCVDAPRSKVDRRCWKDDVRSQCRVSAAVIRLVLHFQVLTTTRQYTIRYSLYDSTLHYTTLHYTTLHYTTLHYTTLHYTTLHSTLHYTTLRYTTLHYTLHYTTLHTTLLHCTTLHYTLHDTTTLYDAPSHHAPLPCIAQQLETTLIFAPFFGAMYYEVMDCLQQQPWHDNSH